MIILTKCIDSYSYNNKWELVLINSSISAFSGAKRFLFSSYISPAVEKSRSEGTDIGGAKRYRNAKSLRE